MEGANDSQEPVPVDLEAPFKPNRPDVIDEQFEGEAVLVNLQSGCYYALNDAGTAIWQALTEGRSTRALADGLQLDREVAAAFVGELIAEDLVELTAADAGPHGLVPLADNAETPSAQRFTDMQDLLMLDPIHDINLDGDGWPVTAPAE